MVKLFGLPGGSFGSIPGTDLRHRRARQRYDINRLITLLLDVVMEATANE